MEKSCQSEDFSVIGNSLDVNVQGVKQLLKAVKEGTDEFQALLFNECSLIYECKVCRNLFRSVANFICHKKSFCQRQYQYFNHGSFNDDMDVSTKLSCEESRKEENCSGRRSTKVMQTKASLMKERSPLSFTLESIPSTRHAVYQTVSLGEKSPSKPEKRNSNSTSRDSILETDGTAVLSEQGNVLRGNFECDRCKATFTSTRALDNHRNIYHKLRTCFACPLCKLMLASAFSVYRHLNKIHSKTSEQIRRLRPTVLSKSMERELYEISTVQSTKPVPKKKDKVETSEEDKYPCMSCGKYFLSQSAYRYHSTRCKPGGVCCEKCGREFARQAVLTAHVSSCKGNSPLPVRSHLCLFCGRKFLKQKQLILHGYQCSRSLPRSPVKYLLSPKRPSDLEIPEPKSKLEMVVKRLQCSVPPKRKRNHVISSIPKPESKLGVIAKEIRRSPPNGIKTSVQNTLQENEIGFGGSLLQGIASSDNVDGESMSSLRNSEGLGAKQSGIRYFKPLTETVADFPGFGPEDVSSDVQQSLKAVLRKLAEEKRTLKASINIKMTDD